MALESCDCDNLKDIPIPPLKEPSDWGNVPIYEDGEALVALNNIAPGVIQVRPQYHQQGIPEALPILYLRRTAAARLLLAAESLPPGCSLVIWDAWRPLPVQQNLFEKHLNQVRIEHPELSEPAILALATQKVSWPTHEINRPSPHSTGGAVDLTIADADGKYLNMGTDFDDFGPRSLTRYFEVLLFGEDALTTEEKVSMVNRRLLYHVLTGAGFSNYCNEWWHFDYGNQFWGAVTGHSARYGCVPTVRDISC